MAGPHKSDSSVASVDVHDGDPWMSLNQASELRGKAKTVVLLEALDGKIHHQKVAGRRFFHRGDIEKLVAAGAATESTESDED